MNDKYKYRLFIVLTTITYITMVSVNALANILPINGRNTGQISDAYANLFAPIGFTFSIWGVIYLLLAGYTIYQFKYWSSSNEAESGFITKINIWFTISSVANLVWIFAWHYDLIPLSLVMMLVILASLIKINLLTKKLNFEGINKWFIRLPFSVYFGWITVATIANVTTLLVYLNWNGFGIADYIWTDAILLIGLGITLTTILRQKDIAYGLVIIWAYFGILAKHLSPDYFDGSYISIIVTLAISLLALVAAEIMVIRLNTFSEKYNNATV